MIGPAGTFAGPQATDYEPWAVRTFLESGRRYETQRFATEAEAREIAAIRGRVHGQKSWTMEVYGPDGYVTTYKGGCEVRPKKAKEVKS